MAAPTRTPPEKWIEEGLRALAAGGPEAVRIEPLAKTLGVSRGGFYWHFDGRSALLEQMLDTWERRVVDEAVDRVESGGGDARARLRRLFALASTGEALPEINLLRTELAIRDWARRDTAVGTRLKRVDNRRMEYMRTLFGDFCPDQDEVEVRCLLAFSLFIASSLIAADHRARTRAEVREQALARLLA